MKIVIADPIFLTEEYIKRLKALGELEIYDNVPTSQDEFIERIKDAKVLIVGRYGVDAKALNSAPKLKMISLWQTGFDNVDLEAATERRIIAVSYTHLRAHETGRNLVCRLLLEK